MNYAAFCAIQKIRLLRWKKRINQLKAAAIPAALQGVLRRLPGIRGAGRLLQAARSMAVQPDKIQVLALQRLDILRKAGCRAENSARLNKP